jgi:hypothetical protein
VDAVRDCFTLEGKLAVLASVVATLLAFPSVSLLRSVHSQLGLWVTYYRNDGYGVTDGVT